MYHGRLRVIHDNVAMDIHSVIHQSLYAIHNVIHFMLFRYLYVASLTFPFSLSFTY